VTGIAHRHGVGAPLSSLQSAHTTNDFRIITTWFPEPGKPGGGVLVPYQPS
jgi:hypothetical protein